MALHNTLPRCLSWWFLEPFITFGMSAVPWTPVHFCSISNSQSAITFPPFFSISATLSSSIVALPFWSVFKACSTSLVTWGGVSVSEWSSRSRNTFASTSSAHSISFQNVASTASNLRHSFVGAVHSHPRWHTKTRAHTHVHTHTCTHTHVHTPHVGHG